ncbi:MAG: glucose 1-dehydrogenase [Alphaproteobacteria bacterium]|nr:glucose 1-dehydrogenase [Alphaproteobacteria bacterium]
MLAGKVAVVTGGAQGMGASDAEAMIAQGAKVVITDVNTEKGAETEKRLSARGSCKFLKHDVTDEASWKQVVKTTLDTFGGLDILVNNAGVGGRASVEKTTLETWRKTMEVNGTGVFLGMQAVYPHMKAQKRGSIINIASVNGLMGARYPDPETTANAGYYASKGAVVILTKLAATQFGPHGIRVNAICPGVIRTEMSSSSFSDPDRMRYFENVIPYNRFGSVEDVAAAVVFLASDLAGFINGVALPVDGGQTAKA